MADIHLNDIMTRQLEALASSQRMSVEEYVASLLPVAVVAQEMSPDQFDEELERLSFAGPTLPVDFSRADIYFDHD